MSSSDSDMEYSQSDADSVVSYCEPAPTFHQFTELPMELQKQVVALASDAPSAEELAEIINRKESTVSHVSRSDLRQSRGMMVNIKLASRRADRLTKALKEVAESVCTKDDERTLQGGLTALEFAQTYQGGGEILYLRLEGPPNQETASEEAVEGYLTMMEELDTILSNGQMMPSRVRALHISNVQQPRIPRMWWSPSSMFPSFTPETMARLASSHETWLKFLTLHKVETFGVGPLGPYLDSSIEDTPWITMPRPPSFVVHPRTLVEVHHEGGPVIRHYPVRYFTGTVNSIKIWPEPDQDTMFTGGGVLDRKASVTLLKGMLKSARQSEAQLPRGHSAAKTVLDTSQSLGYLTRGIMPRHLAPWQTFSEGRMMQLVADGKTLVQNHLRDLQEQYNTIEPEGGEESSLRVKLVTDDAPGA